MAGSSATCSFPPFPDLLLPDSLQFPASFPPVDRSTKFVFETFTKICWSYSSCQHVAWCHPVSKTKRSTCSFRKKEYIAINLVLTNVIVTIGNNYGIAMITNMAQLSLLKTNMATTAGCLRIRRPGCMRRISRRCVHAQQLCRCAH